VDTIKTIVIANRGEIALRINATCQALGIKTIALYTQEDQSLSYVFHADQSYKLPQNGLAGYLDQEAIIEIAQRASANAIHPGYGFLAENDQFAQKVIDAKLIWVGPSPSIIKAVANKTQAQKVMSAAGIPTIPGYSCNTSKSDSFAEAKNAADIIGYPIILKSADGGGGKAMRSVSQADQFDACWKSVVSESQKFFRSDNIIVEKQLEHARHVEVQIAGDGDNYIHLYERECSIQRNHQKVIETAPCLFLDSKTKTKLLDTAIAAAQAISYDHIGTVEFLVTTDQQFYFLEMNTRLQVEHAITEATTGIDLVAMQIHLAAHKQLPYKQLDITQSGYAIECRIYAENPSQNFAPSTGTITNLTLPNGPFLRIDHDLEEWQEITPFFDPMLAKITTWANKKELAIARMVNTLKQTNISGLNTNISFLKAILESSEFVQNQIYTKLLHDKNYFQAKQNNKPLFTKTEYRDLARYIEQTNKKKQTDSNTQTQSLSQDLWRNKRWRNPL